MPQNTTIDKEVILVNEKDHEIGSEKKLEAHIVGTLHRAFSILIFNDQGEMMLQRRCKNKYHSPSLWTNACCSHPAPGEALEQIIHARLLDEMGFDCELKPLFSFIYKVQFDSGLYEHEYDHVFVGYYNGEPVLNPEEADEWKWMSMEDLRKDLNNHPECYTYWFREIVERLSESDFERFSC